ncbi:zinc finger and BTB domain-containing protein 26-like [Halichoeres trimaculatus]|uniref:zinc finger and BTB domain-containing protein 26-like n=1 Tax=Halichoeres trimaculatus TaxID=147232 RepID=UPI003D9F1E74
MARTPDTLLFRFTTHADSILTKMNALREELRFCDITLLVGDPAQPLCFHGHRVVLAASSDFLRDQFLLHDGCAELRVGVVSSVEVGRRLLLACYTGLLEVPLRELVSFLTAASALQMTQVAEKCAQAVSQYLSPTLAFLQLNKLSKEEEIQQTENSGSGASLENEGEKDAARPGSSIQEVFSEECEAKPKVRLTPKVDIQGRKEVRDKRGEALATKELHGGAAYCVNTLESEGGEQTQPDHQESSQAEDTTGEPEEPEESLDSKKKDKVEEDKKEETVSVQRPYLCRRCDRVFQDLESYLGHLKEHRQYLCLVCGKGFSQKSSLTRHIHVHAGVKLFRCPLCHKTFSHKATLQDHLSLHTGDTPHQCHYCSVHFEHKLGLKRHVRGFQGRSSMENLKEETVQ